MARAPANDCPRDGEGKFEIKPCVRNRDGVPTSTACLLSSDGSTYYASRIAILCVNEEIDMEAALSGMNFGV